MHITSRRQQWDDGSFSQVTTVRFSSDAFSFADIDQCERSVKLKQVANLKAFKAQAIGIPEPCAILFACLERDQATSELFASVDAHTSTGEYLYSANSLITYTLRTLLAHDWLHFDGTSWAHSVPSTQPTCQERARIVLELLTRGDRLGLYGKLGRPVATSADLAGFDARRHLVPVGKLGFVREFVWHNHPRVAFNAAFFLLEHDDYFSHHSALGQAYNLCVNAGKILRPPLYKRGAFVQTAEGLWKSKWVSLDQLTITLPQGTLLVPHTNRVSGMPFTLNPPSPSEVSVYTRAYGVAQWGAPLRSTPVNADRIEYTVVDTRIVGRQVGGGLQIPQNGLILSFDRTTLPRGFPKDGLPRVQYDFGVDALLGAKHAIQVGPLLLQDQRRVLSATSLVDEEFWPTPVGQTGPDQVGVVPTDYPDDVNHTRAGRIGLGATKEGDLVVVAMPGTERGAHRPELDSAGATLLELADLLEQAGAVDAINLDGGGSTQLFWLGGLATVPGNRFGIPGLHFERMVPSIGVLD